MCGIGVTSVIDTTVSPPDCNERTADSLSAWLRSWHYGALAELGRNEPDHAPDHDRTNGSHHMHVPLNEMSPNQINARA